MIDLFNFPKRVRAIFDAAGKKPPYSPDDVRAALTQAKTDAMAELQAALQKTPPNPP